MKTLKFKSKLVPRILSGEKTITWRMFDDKNLQKGDLIGLLNTDGGTKFGEVEIIGIQEKKIKELTEADLKNNNHRDLGEVLDMNRGYYGDKVSPDTVVKIVGFKLINNGVADT